MRPEPCSTLALTLPLTLILCASPGLALAQDEPAAPAATPAAPTAPAASQPAPPAASPREPGAAEVERCLREQPDGAPLSQLRQAALEYAMVSPAKVNEALRGARMRGLYPTVHLLGLYRNNNLEQEQQLKDMVYSSQYKSGLWPYKDQILTDGAEHGVFAGLLLKFDFSTLAGGRESLEALKASRLRSTLVEKVTALYFKRRRLRIRYCASTAPASRRLLLKARIDEITALLEGLAGKREERRGGGDVK